MLFSDSLFADFVSVVIALVIIFITYFKWNHTYWKRKKFSCTVDPAVPFGNVGDAIKGKENIGLIFRRLYNQAKNQRWPHVGVYILANPTYIPVDLEFVKNIMTKDFHHFVDRGIYYDEENDPLGAHLFAIGGTKWRNLRTKLTPTFTSGKMKMMFSTLLECETNLLNKIEDQYQKKVPIDIKEVLGCFTTDIIGSCAFGLDFNTFKDDDSPFRRYGKKTFGPGVIKGLTNSFIMNFPNVSKFLKLRQVSKDVSDFFMKLVKDTVEYREKNNVTRKDFMELLIELKDNKVAEEDGYKHDGQSLTVEEVAAQSYVFFLAGFETSSTTMTFALYEMAKNQDVQEKVRREVRTILAKHDGKLTYEAIQDMKYLNKVINETLRKYPPLSFVTRNCVKDYKVPNTDLIVEKGTRIIIPILGIHYDKEYYPDPEKFDPERFNEENSNSRHQYAHIPFGEGPRICIGLRFGMMQSKVGLASLLTKYKFTLSQKTKEPLKFQVRSIVLAAQGEIWLDVEKL